MVVLSSNYCPFRLPLQVRAQRDKIFRVPEVSWPGIVSLSCDRFTGLPTTTHPSSFTQCLQKPLPLPDSILQLSSWANSTGNLTTAFSEDSGTCSSTLLGAGTEKQAETLSGPEMPSNCNSQKLRAMGRETRKQREQWLENLELFDWLPEQEPWVGGAWALRRFWEGEMEGSVSNVMVCNLAYTGKLDELKESILADKSLATRTDQVKQSEGLALSRGRQRSPTRLTGPELVQGHFWAPPAPSSLFSLGLAQDLLPYSSPQLTFWGEGEGPST